MTDAPTTPHPVCTTAAGSTATHRRPRIRPRLAGIGTGMVLFALAAEAEARECPLPPGTSGTCQSQLRLRDPLSMRSRTVLWEQSVRFAGDHLERMQERVSATAGKRRPVAELVREFSEDSGMVVTVRRGSKKGSVVLDPKGTVVRDTVTPDKSLMDVLTWLNPPGSSELQEDCKNTPTHGCLCQCITADYFENVGCGIAKILAIADDECTLSGWWYCQNNAGNGGGSKCQK